MSSGSWTGSPASALEPLPAASGTDYWAPEVAEHDGAWWMYYSVGHGDRHHQLRVAVADRPTGPFRDQGVNLTPDEPFAIDASPFRDTDGALYLLWKNDGNAVGADTWLWSQRLSADGLALAGKPARLLKQTAPWEGTLVEGPFMWRHDGRLYLFYAANDYGSADYAEGYAVCATPSGPCSKAPGNPILRSRGKASGPGHASIVEKDGRTWLLYHAWPAGQEGSVDPGRQLWLDELLWANGDPVVRGPTDAPQPLP
jgi:beta-xylosidase